MIAHYLHLRPDEIKSLTVEEFQQAVAWIDDYQESMKGDD